MDLQECLIHIHRHMYIKRDLLTLKHNYILFDTCLKVFYILYKITFTFEYIKLYLQLTVLVIYNANFYVVCFIFFSFKLYVLEIYTCI